MTARKCVGMLIVGVKIPPNLVAQVLGEDSGFSGFEACLPEFDGRVSPSVGCRERAEPDAWNDLG